MSTSSYDARNPAMMTAGTTTVDTTTAMSGGAHTHRRISWAAIFGGVILVVALQLLLSLLGAGIGLGTVDTNAGSTPSASSFGIGAGVWWVVSSCLSLLIGGYVSAWLAGIEVRFDGLLHGLVTWAIATLLTFWLLSTAIGGIIGGGFSALGTVASAAGTGVSDAAKPLAQAAGVSPDMIQQQAQAYLQPSSSPDPASMTPQDAQKAVATDLATYAGGGADAPAAKDQIIAIMAAQRHVSHDEAAKQFDDAQTKLKQTRDHAIQTAKNAADASAAAASTTAFAGFRVLLLGLVAAAVGGSIAVQRRLLVSHRTVDGPIRS